MTAPLGGTAFGRVIFGVRVLPYESAIAVVAERTETGGVALRYCLDSNPLISASRVINLSGKENETLTVEYYGKAEWNVESSMTALCLWDSLTTLDRIQRVRHGLL